MPNKPIRLLHLSDIHFKADKAWDADPVLRGLAQFIALEISKGLVPDAVAITGDLAFSGTAEEYGLARQWLEQQLWPALPKDFPHDRLLLVPGNHDVDRAKVDFVAQAVQKALLARPDQNPIAAMLGDSGQREVLLKRHAAYLSFLSDWLGQPQALPWWQRTVDIRGTRLHVAGLDSAFMAYGDADRGNLLLGRRQIHETVIAKDAEQADWRIALLHHPWDYLAEFDGDEARALIHQHCDLLLRGHLHKPQLERIVPPDPARACLELAAGCVYEHSRYPNAFQWVELWPEPKRVRVLFRAWLHNAWAIDRNQPGCPDGVAEFNFVATPETTKPVPAATPPDGPDTQALDRYREVAGSVHASLPIAGFKTKLRVPISLEELYVPLHANVDLRASGGCGFADAGDAEAKLREHGSLEIPLISAFREAHSRKRRGLVILGDPGSGKTTHLKRLLLACLRENPAGNPLLLGEGRVRADLDLPPGTLPVFLPLRELDDLTQGLDAFIEKTLDSPHLAMPRGFGAKLLQRGGLLLLLDGLDEVSDPTQRAKVSRWIEQAAQARPSCALVVTCRFAGYDDAARLGPEFLELHLRPLTAAQAELFIRQWYRAVETKLAATAAQGEMSAAQRSDELIERLRQPDFRAARMAEMPRNPLLLANLCLVHYDRRSLPRNRHQLYEECIEVLLERWREAKSLPVAVSADVGRSVLQPVALWLHGEDGRTRATAAELAPVIEPVLRTVKWRDGDAAAFLRAVRDESGLLTGWGPDQFGFMHLGFQEYLAACELRQQALRAAVEGGKADGLAGLARHYGASWWQEVILLLLAQGKPSLFTPFMREAIAQPGFDAADAMTGLVLEEAAEATAAPFLERVRQAPGDDAALAPALHLLERLLPEDERLALADTLRGHPSPMLRAWAQGQARSAALPTLKTSNGGVELVLIPGGKFWMGSPDGVCDADEYPQHEVEIQPFYMGRYPVTNEEYARFLATNPDVEDPKYWADRRFNQARQPVVGVSWHDACRFAAWAGGRLPSEAEWEYAARAGTVTQWFWGDDGTQAGDYAWFGGNSAGSSHPVGEKRPNPFGLYDMAGNAWDWTQDVWHDDYRDAPVDGSAWEIGGVGGRRVVRGGSWVNEAVLLRPANRLRYAASDRNFNLGFRLVQDL